MTTAAARRENSLNVRVGELGPWILGLGYACLAIPTIVRLGHDTWSKEIGAHGPIILATGAWLLWRQFPEFKKEAVRGPDLLTAALLLPSLAAYIFGRTYGFLLLEVGGLYGSGLAILNSLLGWRLLVKNWFPLLYLGFMIPPPTWILDALTLPLKQFVTFISTSGLHALGYPIARDGVIITVAQYNLQVEDACSGMHSILGLVAITLLYVYLMHGPSWRYCLLFTALAIPIAIVANILRIITLILLTYYAGDEVAQGFLHFTAGILLFGSALLLVFAIDRALTWFINRARAPA